MREQEYDQLRKKIKQVIDNGHRDFIIFPYGKFGKMAEQCLNEFNIKPTAILDNFLSQENNQIENILYLNNGGKNSILLIATNRYDVYNQNKHIIEANIPKEQVVFLFSLFEQLMKPVSLKEKLYNLVISPRGKEAFYFRKVRNSKETKMLDVGCGNQSALWVKEIL